MYLHAIRSLAIQRIQHYYLEEGHTQNERDSDACCNRESVQACDCIYSNAVVFTLASSAKKSGRPYTVTEMEGHMKDFKVLAE